MTDKIQTKLIIQAMKSQRCLWDKYCTEYKAKGAKDAAWLEIYRAVEPKYDELTPTLRHELRLKITKKWYNIRDAYVKSIKGRFRNRPYQYSEEMSFLQKIYDANDTKQDLEEDAEDDKSENWFSEVFVDVDENAEETPKKKAKEDKIEENDSFLAILNNLIEREEDEDRAFFKSITPHVKKLSTERKMEFRIEVMKLLMNLNNKEKRMKEEISQEESGDDI